MLRKIVLLASLVGFQEAQGQTSGPFENLDSNVNTKYAEVRPTVSADGKILYLVVEGHPANTFSKLSNKAQDIWFSEKAGDGKWAKAQQGPSVLNNQKSNAVFWISPDGNQLLLRGAYDSGKYLGRGISMTQRTATGWAPPQQLNIKKYDKVSNDAYSGAVMVNGGKVLLFYLSEEKNSFINDIYVSFLISGNDWTEPELIPGPISLDEYNDITPYMAADGVTLYFSSDRPGGKGDHDIWMAKRLDETWKKWSEPVNVANVNTKGWDAYFAIDASGEKAFISTTQNAIGATDIATVPIEEKDRPNPVVLVYGKIFDAATRQPLGAGLSYDLLPEGTNEGMAISNPADGSYKLVLPYGKAHRINTSMDKYFPMIDTVDFTSVDKYMEVHRDIYLNALVAAQVPDTTTNGDDGGQGEKTEPCPPALLLTNDVNLRKNIDSLSNIPLEEGMIITLNNILFDFDKSLLRSESYNELDKAVVLLRKNPAIKIELSAHTDNMGTDEYNNQLSTDRAYSATQYLVSKGIESVRIVSKGYGETKPVATNKTAAGRQLNRRVELKVLEK